MESIQTVEIKEIFEQKVWIESDFMGSKHVMIQHQDGESRPFCYCSFHYNYAYTSNSGVREQAEKMAIQLGAGEPVEYKSRPFNFDA